MTGPTSTIQVTSFPLSFNLPLTQRDICLTNAAKKKAAIPNVKGKAQADTFSSYDPGNTFDSQPVSTENPKMLYTIRK